MKKVILSNIGKRFGNIEVCLTLGFACLLDPRYKDHLFQLFNAKSIIVNKLKEKLRKGDDEKKIVKRPTTSSNVAASARSLDRMYATVLQSCEAS